MALISNLVDSHPVCLESIHERNCVGFVYKKIKIELKHFPFIVKIMFAHPSIVQVYQL